jgi:hypothetical protein
LAKQWQIQDFFRKFFIFRTLLICLKGFESPWGYWLKG